MPSVTDVGGWPPPAGGRVPPGVGEPLAQDRQRVLQVGGVLTPGDPARAEPGQPADHRVIHPAADPQRHAARLHRLEHLMDALEAQLGRVERGPVSRHSVLADLEGLVQGPTTAAEVEAGGLVLLRVATRPPRPDRAGLPTARRGWPPTWPARPDGATPRSGCWSPAGCGWSCRPAPTAWSAAPASGRRGRWVAPRRWRRPPRGGRRPRGARRTPRGPTPGPRSTPTRSSSRARSNSGSHPPGSSAEKVLTPIESCGSVMAVSLAHPTATRRAIGARVSAGRRSPEGGEGRANGRRRDAAGARRRAPRASRRSVTSSRTARTALDAIRCARATPGHRCGPQPKAAWAGRGARSRSKPVAIGDTAARPG